MSVSSANVKAIEPSDVKISVSQFEATIRQVVLSENWGKSQHDVKEIFTQFCSKLTSQDIQKLGSSIDGVREQIVRFEGSECPQPRAAYALLANLEFLIDGLGFQSLRKPLDDLDVEIEHRWPDAKNWTQGIAGRRVGNPKSVTIHNTAGSSDAAFYEEFIKRKDAATGFAHEYHDDKTVFCAEPVENKAWHCGNPEGNRDSIGLEICKDKCSDPAPFQEAERRVIVRTKEILDQFGLPADEATIRFHCEWSATQCPWRTIQDHGGNIASAKAWFIGEVRRLIQAESVRRPVGEFLLVPVRVASTSRVPSVKRRRCYSVDECAILFGKFLQIRCNELAPAGFSWKDNGILCDWVEKIAHDRSVVPRKEFSVGDSFAFKPDLLVGVQGESVRDVGRDWCQFVFKEPAEPFNSVWLSVDGVDSLIYE
ncbi:MAG: N-acetylmuramoyl-L-alanine amidase [Lactobacillales bacterium]|nr:N-acetylmuramoyl-L-alanine amidase [Lactobacillales bacterium]